MHYWRTPDGRWHEQPITDTSSTVGRGEDWTRVIDWRGDMFMDEQDNIYAYFPLEDDVLYVAQAKRSEGWRTWTVYPLTDVDTTLPHYLINQAGQKYDRFRWARDGVLSVPLVIRRDGRDAITKVSGKDAKSTMGKRNPGNNIQQNILARTASSASHSKHTLEILVQSRGTEPPTWVGISETVSEPASTGFCHGRVDVYQRSLLVA